MKFKNILCLAFVAWTSFLSPTFAEEGLPAAVSLRAGTQFQAVGEGTYRKFGFRIYHAVLWAPDGTWNPDKPYALELHYLRSLSKDTLSDSIIDDIHDQNATDETTMARWERGIKKTMPAVEDGDIMIGLIVPDKEGVLYLNGDQIGETLDTALSKAFLNIWLGKDADEDLKKELLNQKSD